MNLLELTDEANTRRLIFPCVSRSNPNKSEEFGVRLGRALTDAVNSGEVTVIRMLLLITETNYNGLKNSPLDEELLNHANELVK